MNSRGRNKIPTLIFNESKRKEFLCGFRKRKMIRQQKAQEELQHQVMIEKKKLKENVQDNYEKMVYSKKNLNFKKFHTKR